MGITARITSEEGVETKSIVKMFTAKHPKLFDDIGICFEYPKAADELKNEIPIEAPPALEAPSKKVKRILAIKDKALGTGTGGSSSSSSSGAKTVAKQPRRPKRARMEKLD